MVFIKIAKRRWHHWKAEKFLHNITSEPFFKQYLSLKKPLTK